MKKLLLSVALIGSSLMADTAITKVVAAAAGKKGAIEKEIELPKEFSQDLRLSIQKVWDDVVKNPGEAKILFFVDSRKGRIIKGIVLSKHGDKKFFKDFKYFLKELRNVRFKRLASDSKIIQVTMVLKKEGMGKGEAKHDPVSPLKDRGNKVYDQYLQLLMKNKGYTKQVIKKILNEKRRTISKTMLLAVYHDYVKNDEKTAGTYYETAYKYRPQRFTQTEEGVYLADYFLRKGEDAKVLEILPKRTCEFFNKDYRYLCFWYQAKAMYDLGIPEFELPLNQAKYHVPQATKLWKQVRKKPLPKKQKRRKK